MENQAQPSSMRKLIFIVAIVLVLSGTGFFVWRLLRPKEGEQEQTEGKDSSTTTSTINKPISGRTNTNTYSTAQLQNTNITNPVPTPKTPAPPPKPVWIGSDEGQALLVEKMKRIQQSSYDNELVRKKYEVGKNLIKNSQFTTAQQVLIDKMFTQFDHVKTGDYTTYPIYGKYEKEGADLKRDLEEYIKKGYGGYNLSTARHGGDIGWLGSVQLNLFYGVRGNSYVDTADKIWWSAGGEYMRKGLDFYKAFNGFNVSDQQLTEKHGDGTAVYKAGNVWALVQLWIKEINYFDEVTRQVATDSLVAENLVFLNKPKDAR